MGRHVMEAKCCEESRENQVCRNVEIRRKKSTLRPCYDIVYHQSVILKVLHRIPGLLLFSL